MGHSTATAEFTADGVKRIRENESSAVISYGYRSDSLVDAAVRQWRDSDDGYGDPNVGNVITLPISAPAVRSRALDEAMAAGHTFIQPFTSEQDVVRRKVTVKVVSAEAAELAELRTKVGKNFNGAPWDAPATAKAIEPHMGEFESMTVVSVTAPRKPVARATAGKMVTKHQVVKPSRFRSGQDDVLAVRDSMADARQAALDLMTADASIADLAVKAVQVRATDDGATNAALLTVTRPETNSVITLEVTLATPKAGAEPATYLVGFDVHY